MEEDEDPRDKHPGSATLAKKACAVPRYVFILVPQHWLRRPVRYRRCMSFRFSLASSELVYRWPRWWAASWASAGADQDNFQFCEIYSYKKGRATKFFSPSSFFAVVGFEIRVGKK